MSLSNAHNLNTPSVRSNDGRWGIRVSLPAGDPFTRLLDADWQRVHWFATREERDATLADMARRHEYSRDTDRPALNFEAIEREIAD